MFGSPRRVTSRASLQSERSAKQEASPHATLERLHDAGASFQSRFLARLILPRLCSPLPIYGGRGNPPIPALLVVQECPIVANADLLNLSSHDLDCAIGIERWLVYFEQFVSCR